MPRVVANNEFWIRNGVLDISRITGTVPGPARTDGFRAYYDDAQRALMASVDGGAYWPLAAPSPPAVNATGCGILGDGTTDDTAAIQGAIDTLSAGGGGDLVFPPGTYRLSRVYLKSNVRLRAAGGALFSAIGTSPIPMVEILGTVGETSASLSGNANPGDVTLTVPSTAGFTAGDTALVKDDRLMDEDDASGPNQEPARIKSLTATTLTFYSGLIGDYLTSAAARVHPYAPVVNAGVYDLAFTVPQGKKGGAFRGRYCHHCEVSGCRSTASDTLSHFVWETSAYECHFRRSSAIDVADPSVTVGGSNYGFVIGETALFCSIDSCYAENVRENPVGGYVRHCRVTNNHFKNSYINGVNTHGDNNHHILIQGNLIEESAQDGIGVGSSGSIDTDSAVLITGNIIRGCARHGIVANAAAGEYNENVLIAGNLIEECGRVNAAGYGIVAIRLRNSLIEGNLIRGGSTLQKAGIRIIESAGVVVTGNRIRSLPASSTDGIRWDTSSSDVVIEGNHVRDVTAFAFRDGDGTSTGVVLRANTANQTSVTLGTADSQGNNWGGVFDQNRGATSVADGGTITHGLRSTPAWAIVTPSTSGEFASVTAKGATTFTVSLKTHMGAAGTMQTVYWEAGV